MGVVACSVSVKRQIGSWILTWRQMQMSLPPTRSSSFLASCCNRTDRKHLSRVLALRTELGACTCMPNTLDCRPNPPQPFRSPCCQQSPTKINPRCARTFLAHMLHDERQHPRHPWAAASMTQNRDPLEEPVRIEGCLRAIESVAMHRNAKSTADTRPQTQGFESVRYDRVSH